MSARGLRVEATRDRHRIEAFLRRSAAMHVYALADLDDERWPQTRWWIALDGDRIRAVCLLLEALHVPLFYLVCPPHDPAAGELLRAVRPELPGHFFFNLGEGLREVLAPGFSHVIEGRFVKMILFDPRVAARVDPAGVDPLGPGDFAELQRFYANDAYAEDESDSRFFEPYMLASGAYRCIREQGRLVCVAGVHVQSPRMGVAALGNIATHPPRRGRGLGRRATAAVLRALTRESVTIGLNVMTSNAAAIRCYEGLGFRRVLTYWEGTATRE